MSSRNNNTNAYYSSSSSNRNNLERGRRSGSGSGSGGGSGSGSGGCSGSGSGVRSGSRNRSSSRSNNRNSNSNSNVDFYAAQQLQEQYRQDYIQSQSQFQPQQQRPSAPPESIMTPPPDGLVFRPPLPSQVQMMKVGVDDEDEGEIMGESFEVSFPPSPFAPSRTAEDERYARQLQQEIEREERLMEAARQRHRASARTSARTSATSRSPYEITPVINHHNVQSPSHEDARLAQQLQDEELARQMATSSTRRGAAAAARDNAESSGRESARAVRVPRSSRLSTRNNEPGRRSSSRTKSNSNGNSNGNSNSNSNGYTRGSSARHVVRAAPAAPVAPASSHFERYDSSHKGAPFTNSTAGSDVSSGDDDDMDVLANIRIAQEMEDAEMAQRLALFEEEAQSRRDRDAAAAAATSGRRSRILVGRILPLFCCAGAVAVALLFILGVFDPADIPFVGDRLGGNNGSNDDDWVDPFAGDGIFKGNGNSDGSIPIVNRQEQMGWSSDGRSGIQLEILNALEDKWQSFLDTAVQNWDQGYPIDSLTLSVTRVGYEVECTAVTGKIKVCNADYGPTRWRGLNEVMLNSRTNIIVSSSAKMNEYYLLDEGADQQLYTMCHELGHGFGLPHWDEDFFNKDLGNCMDYTNNPDKNKRPDATNFEFLSQIYGGVNITNGQLVSAAEATTAFAATVAATSSSTSTSTSTSSSSTTSDAGGRRLGSSRSNNNNNMAHEQQPTQQQQQQQQQGMPPQQRGLAYWATAPAEEPSSSSATTSSTTLISRVPNLDDQDQQQGQRRRRRRRVVLQANEHFEVHRLEPVTEQRRNQNRNRDLEYHEREAVLQGDGNEDDEFVTLQLYLMV